MKTILIKVQHADTDDESIQQAAKMLQCSELVAFPTETVYGLGANALNEAAVKKIYAAKGRPANNPIIIHVADINQAKSLVTEWPETADTLARALWPGPLTLILPCKSIVPDIVTAGGSTIGLRIPAHPVARALIKACGFPLAAPSANRSNYISPTTAQHVLRSLDGRIPLILDGGSCEGGIESTVLDLSTGQIKVLRPGLYSSNFLSSFLQREVLSGAVAKEPEAGILSSPGQLATHYAPATPLYLATREQLEFLVLEDHIGLMAFDSTSFDRLRTKSELRIMPGNYEEYARILFATLHELDELGLKAIYCELPPDEQAWAGVMDRLNRAGRRI